MTTASSIRRMTPRRLRPRFECSSTMPGCGGGWRAVPGHRFWPSTTIASCSDASPRSCTSWPGATRGPRRSRAPIPDPGQRRLRNGDRRKRRPSARPAHHRGPVSERGRLWPVQLRPGAHDKAAADRLFRHVLGLKLIWVAVGLALLVVAAPILRSDPQVIRLCYLMGLSSAVRSYLLTARGLLQGLDRFDLEAVVVVADRLLLLAAGGSVLWAGRGVLGLAMAFVISRLVMLAAVTLLLGRVVGSVVPQFERTAWRDLPTAALPLGVFMVTLYLYR